MSRAERLLELLQLLRSYRYPVSGLKLATDLRISIRTLGGGAELAFALNNQNEFEGLYVKWKSQKFPIIQEPTDMDFGHTFVALDPDGHRLRVFVPVAP